MADAVSVFVRIGVTLIILAVVLGVMFMGVSLSRDAGSAGFSFFADVVSSGHDTGLQFYDFSKPLPMLSYATILRQQSRQVITLDCHVCGTHTAGDDLGSCVYGHPEGRGLLVLTSIENGEYTAVLEGA